jgi:hypothetical protein
LSSWPAVISFFKCYTFVYRYGNENRGLWTGFSAYKRVISAVKRVELLSDRIGHWCDNIVVNIHAPTEDKTDDTVASFYEEPECVFNKFHTYHMKILLGDFNAEVGREDIFKPKTENESLHKISNDNGVREVNLATSENLIVKSTMFP